MRRPRYSSAATLTHMTRKFVSQKPAVKTFHTRGTVLRRGHVSAGAATHRAGGALVRYQRQQLAHAGQLDEEVGADEQGAQRLRSEAPNQRGRVNAASPVCTGLATATLPLAPAARERMRRVPPTVARAAARVLNASVSLDVGLGRCIAAAQLRRALVVGLDVLKLRIAAATRPSSARRAAAPLAALAAAPCILRCPQALRQPRGTRGLRCCGAHAASPAAAARHGLWSAARL